MLFFFAITIMGDYGILKSISTGEKRYLKNCQNSLQLLFSVRSVELKCDWKRTVNKLFKPIKDQAPTAINRDDSDKIKVCHFKRN